MSFLFFFPGLVDCYSRNIEVKPGDNNKSIEKKIQLATNHDTLTFFPGEYELETIIIPKPLIVMGIDFPIIKSKTGNEIITVISDSVQIVGLQLEDVETSFMVDRAAIRIKDSNHFLVSNNRLINTFFGIYLEHAGDGLIENNIVAGDATEESTSGNAIHAWYCKNLRIIDNQVTNHRDGIYFEFVDNSLIKGNISADNLRYGLHFMFSNEDEYIENEFRNNGAGVAVMFSKKINMYRNNFLFNWGNSSYGLLLKEIYDAEIANNTFRENTIGIYIEGSTRINYFDNDFQNNGWALKFSGGCLDNHIRGNNFLTNTFDLSVHVLIEGNTFDGNYWSDYSGYDLDKDGKGDVPHRPVKLFNYLINETPETVVLLRSFFVELLNFAERISPVFTPDNVLDSQPLMKKISRSEIVLK